MFKSTTVGIVALTMLSSEVQAMKSKYRPVPGSNPWHKEVTKTSWDKPDWNVDYFVPNFGQDNEIKTSIKNTGLAEKQVGKKMQASFKPPKGHPVDYFVPNFGQDADVKLSLDNASQTETDLKTKWTPDLSKKKALPQNYFVPNFGMDSDIKTTNSNLANAEKKLGKWKVNTGKKAPGPPQNYFVPNFGLDKDIKDTQAHIAQQEKKHGKWTPIQDDNGVWIVPSAANNNNYTYSKAGGKGGKAFVQLDTEEQSASDPICSSAGCNYASEKPKKDAYPMNYFVPSFGRDPELNHVDTSIAWAEKALNHKWEVDMSKKPPGPPQDYFVPDFGLEHDVVETQKHIADQEAIHGPWVPVQDENGEWIVPGPADNKSYTYNANVQLDAEREPLLTWAPKTAADKVPKNYFVPNFGRDPELNNVDQSILAAEKIYKRKLNIDMNKKKEAGPPMDYFVPNFGLDHDLKNTQSHWTAAEAKYGKWDIPDPKKAPPPPPTNYFVPNFGQDMDMIHNGKSLAAAEKIVGKKWDYKFVKPAAGPPMNYPVPNFGMDHDIKDAQANIAVQEKLHGAWNPVQDDNGVWQMPSAASAKSYTYNKSLVQVDSEVEREPLLSWSAKAPASHPTNYFVPNFGADKNEVLTTANSLKKAEEITKKKWNYKYAKPVAGPPMNYKVPNFGVDQDIKDAQTNIAFQEKLHGAWNPVQDDNGVWVMPSAASAKSYSYKAQQSLVQSDPISGSLGFPARPSKKEAPIVQYPDPEVQGLEADIKHSQASEVSVSKTLGKTWVWEE